MSGMMRRDAIKRTQAECAHYCAACKTDAVQRAEDDPDIADLLAEARAEERERVAQAIEARIVKVSDEDIDGGGFETGIDVGCEIAYRAAARIAREAPDA